MIAARPVGGASVSAIGFGAGPIGGFRGAVDGAQAESALAAYWAAGGRYFDTSPLYGYVRSELRVGAFLRENRGGTISTKVGRVMRAQRAGDDLSQLRPGGLPFWPEFDYSYDGAMRSLEQSMLRTGLTRFDIVLIHDLERDAHGAATPRVFDLCMQGAYRALRTLREAGDVAAIGVGVNDTAAARAFVEAGEFDAVMLAGRYSLLDHDDEVLSFFDLCLARGVGVLAAGVFNSGILATGAGGAARYAYGPPLDRITARVAAIGSVCERFGAALPAAAIQFAQGHPAVRSVVLGSGDAANVARNVGHATARLAPGFWAALVADGLLPAALVPQDAGGAA